MRFLALLGITEVSLLECVSLWSPQSDVVLTLNAIYPLLTLFIRGWIYQDGAGSVMRAIKCGVHGYIRVEPEVAVDADCGWIEMDFVVLLIARIYQGN